MADRASVTAAALSDVASAVVFLDRVVGWALDRGADSPGGDDLAALAGYSKAWAVRLGVEIADALAADTDAAGVLGAHG